MIEILRETLARLRRGESVMHVTVLAAQEAPRGAGAKLAVFEDGAVLGTVGGGETERGVIETARRALKERRSFIEEARSCGGRATLLFRCVRPEEAETLREALTLAQAGKPARMETRLSGAMEMQAVSGGTGAHAACSEDGETFSELLSAGRAYVFGGGHVSRALCPLLARTGFCVTVLDDREDVLTESAFPDAEARIVGPLAQSAARISLEPNDFVVVMTHGHHLDYEVLRETLRQPLAYVGMIGSKKKIGAISARLLADGIPQERVDSVHMPIGLAIGAETPEEIAVSIAAEMIRCRAVRAGSTKL